MIYTPNTEELECRYVYASDLACSVLVLFCSVEVSLILLDKISVWSSFALYELLVDLG